MSRKDLLPAETPKCFPSEKHFRIWSHAARITGGCHEVGHCTDCTPQYKRDMLAAGRCERPEIIFAPDEHGFIQGTRQQTIQE